MHSTHQSTSAVSRDTETTYLLRQQLERTDTGQLVVTSLTIAQGTNNQHASILRIIRNNIEDLEEFGRVGFEIAPFETAGGTQRREIAKLNEPQSSLVLTYLRNNEKVKIFKKALVKAFYEMAQRLAEPRPAPADMSRMEILQLAMAAEQENQALRAQAELDAPKVSYMDHFVADNDYHLLRSVASDLNVGERDLRNALRFSGWIYVDSSRRRTSKGEIVTEYQWSEYADKKPYFHRVMNHEAPLFKGNVPYTLKVTTMGAAAISRLVARINAKYGSVKVALPLLEAEHEARRTKNITTPDDGSTGLW